MRRNNTQPFYVGQKVALRIDENLFGYKKGDVFTVLGLKKDCHCWLIDVGWVSPVTINLQCKYCPSVLRLIKGGEFWPDAVCFSPIEPAKIEIASELLQQPVEERLDVPKINEPILS